MDPTQTLADILRLLDGASEGPAPQEACEALRNLADWLDRDGFAPDVVDAIERSSVDVNEICDHCVDHD